MTVLTWITGAWSSYHQPRARHPRRARRLSQLIRLAGHHHRTRRLSIQSKLPYPLQLDPKLTLFLGRHLQDKTPPRRRLPLQAPHHQFHHQDLPPQCAPRRNRHHVSRTLAPRRVEASVQDRGRSSIHSSADRRAQPKRRCRAGYCAGVQGGPGGV